MSWSVKSKATIKCVICFGRRLGLWEELIDIIGLLLFLCLFPGIWTSHQDHLTIRWVRAALRDASYLTRKDLRKKFIPVPWNIMGHALPGYDGAWNCSVLTCSREGALYSPDWWFPSHTCLCLQQDEMFPAKKGSQGDWPWCVCLLVPSP